MSVASFTRPVAATPRVLALNRIQIVIYLQFRVGNLKCAQKLLVSFEGLPVKELAWAVFFMTSEDMWVVI